MHFPAIIEAKRDGRALSREEIEAFVSGFTRGDIPDYQASALAMAIYFQGMDAAETAHLTRAMLHSGDSFTYPDCSPPKVDKHSTGGIGDKTSLVLAPLLACDDLWIPMISGRGLGITGGTLDKLESIPGFNVRLSMDQALDQLATIGVVMAGQSETLCPADKKLYALRDVTGTVPSQPLIVASIMSKKLAESLDSLVLDVKFGSGAFMKNREDAVSLADAMTSVGEKMGVRTAALLNPMDQPLGHAVGNALEVVEAIDTLRGGGPEDLVTLCLDLATEIATVDRDQLAAWLADGTAWKKFVALVQSQGGNPAVLDDFASVHPAPVIRDLPAPRSGLLEKMDAETIGRTALTLGAGRHQADDAVDFTVGFDRVLKTGVQVAKNEPLLRIHARSENDADTAASALLTAVSIA